MPIKFDCPWCSHTLTAPDSAAGVTAPCPKCGVQITAPADGEQPAGAGKASAVGPAGGSPTAGKTQSAPLTSHPLPSSAPTQIPPCDPMPRKAGKDWLTTLLLCLFTGFLGGHRFYTGHITTGIIQALTMGACGLWWLTDLAIVLAGRFRDSTGNRLVGSHYPAVTRWVIGTGVVCMILVILTMASID